MLQKSMFSLKCTQEATQLGNETIPFHFVRFVTDILVMHKTAVRMRNIKNPKKCNQLQHLLEHFHSFKLYLR